jgi:rod shape determining protein RodA
MRDEKLYSGSTDWLLVLLYLFIAGIGLLSVFSSSSEGAGFAFDLSTKYGKQFMWFVISITFGFLLFLFDARFFSFFAWLFYIISILMLMAVLFVGSEMFGSKSWISIGGFSIQPSEFAKLGTAVALARYLGEYGVDVRKWSFRLRALAIIGLPMAFVLLQGDAGSSLVFLCFSLVLYREGLPGYLLVAGIALIVIFVLTLIFDSIAVVLMVTFLAFIVIALNYKRKQIVTLMLVIVGVVASMSFSVDYLVQNVLKEHQRKRILVTLKMLEDPKGIEYNVIQSKIAIGSGGLWGKGFLQGSQTKGDFVPEQSTDFIFCTIGEEFGLVGSWTLVLLYTLLIVRIFFTAERQKTRFGRVYGYGVGSILFMHFMVNIGMAIDLMPVIGIPLPFISYGGSSLFAFTILLFLLIRLDANRENELDSMGQ